ncbi:MAG: PAS domain S-box protein [Bacteroidota bacterium]
MPDPSSNAQRMGVAMRENSPFTALTEALADAVLIVAETGEVLYASERFSDLLRWKPAEVVGTDFFALFHEDDRPMLPDQMAGGGLGVQWTARMLDRDGGTRWMSLGLRQPEGAKPEGTYVLARPLDTPPEITDAAVLFQRALDAANNLVVITDARRKDNPIIFANDYFLEVTGYEEDEVLGRNCRFLQFLPDGTRDDQPERYQLRDAQDAGRPATVLMRNYSKSGDLFWNELYVTPLFDPDGTLTHFIGVQNNVTDRVEAQEDVRRRGALLQSFYDSAPMMMGVTTLSEDGSVVHRSANQTASRFYGVAPEAVEGKTERDLGYTEGESARWQAHYREALASGKPVRFDTCYPWDGDPRGADVRNLTVALNHIPGTGQGGDGHEGNGDEADLPLFSYVVQDVTEQRRTERARGMLEQALESTTTPFLITDADLDRPGPRVTYVNPAYTGMTGYPRDEVVGQTPRLTQGAKTDRALLDRLRRQLEAGEAFHGETVNYRKDGSEYVLNWSIQPIRNPDGEITHYVATQNDVTRRRELEQEVLEISAREQERIASDLHDGLGQVLTGVSFLTASVENRLREQGSPHLEDVAQIRSYVEEAVEQARALAHGLHPVSTEPDGLIKALAYLADTVEAAYGISCSFVYNRPVLVADLNQATHLYRIAQEATTNAVRHGEASEIALSLYDLAAEADPHAAPGEAVLTVFDDGHGITDAALEESDGMGLHTMRNRARRIGGTLEVGRRGEGGTYVRCRFTPEA